jgi:hypothetical protein
MFGGGPAACAAAAWGIPEGDRHAAPARIVSPLVRRVREAIHDRDSAMARAAAACHRAAHLPWLTIT